MLGRLKPAEQNRLLSAWAQFVRDCARAAPPPTQDPAYLDFCGFRDEWQSIRADAAYTAALFSPEPLFGFMGIFGLAGDVVTIAPNIALRETKDYVRWRARRKCTKAAERFVCLAVRYKEKYAQPP